MGAWVCSVARVGGLWRGSGVCRSGSGREKEEDARVAVERCSGAPTRLSSFLAVQSPPLSAVQFGSLMGNRAVVWVQLAAGREQG
jgi:hypothetical protein